MTCHNEMDSFNIITMIDGSTVSDIKNDIIIVFKETLGTQSPMVIKIDTIKWKKRSAEKIL